MAELFLLCMIVTLVVLTIRSGKPVILDNPVVIHRVGQYHMTLAPQLNRAQTFIEKISKQAPISVALIADSSTQFFVVYDEKICASDEKLYLLAVAIRAGIWYFQAINPQPLLHDCDSHLKTLSAFSDGVLVQHPPVFSAQSSSDTVVYDAVQAAAQIMQIKVEKLLPA